MEFKTDFIKQSLSRMEENTAKINRCLSELDENDTWNRPNASSNSIGNQILHLCGNITQYIISGLGQEEDKRRRDSEFESTGGYSKTELREKLGATIKRAKEIINAATESDLTTAKFAQGFSLTGVGIILHVVEHYSYHTGQIIFWTKLLKNKDLGFYAGVNLNVKNKGSDSISKS